MNKENLLHMPLVCSWNMASPVLLSHVVSLVARAGFSELMGPMIVNVPHVAVLSEYWGHICCKSMGHLVDKNHYDLGMVMKCPDCDGMLSKQLDGFSYIDTIFEN